MTTTGTTPTRILITNAGTHHALSVVDQRTTSDVLCGQFLAGLAGWGAVDCKRCLRALDAGRTASRSSVRRRLLARVLGEPGPGK